MKSVSDPTDFDSSEFRNVLGRFPTGVSVVTANTPEGPVGMVIGSFVSVSLEPPLVGWFVDKNSSTWAAIDGAGSWCASILADDQVDLSNQFASKKGAEKYEGVQCTDAPVTGSPILPDVCGWVDCTTEAVHDCGDHWFVLGRVAALATGRDHGPLVFGTGGYCKAEKL